MTETELKLNQVTVNLDGAKAKIKALEKELVNCANELCIRCGSYKMEHLGGPCTDCRYRNIRHGDCSEIG